MHAPNKAGAKIKAQISQNLTTVTGTSYSQLITIAKISMIS
jgi:hypothetical protein